MSSRLKDRGGGGGKVMALKPHKVPSEGTPMGKAAARRTPSAAGKENPRVALPNGKPAPPGMRQRLLPADVQRVDKAAAVAAAVAPPPSVRWSTSSMPKGKASNPSDFARLLADLRAGDGGRSRVSRASVSATDGAERVKSREAAESGRRGSLGTDRVAEKCQQLKKVAALRSIGNGKDPRTGSGLGVLENGKLNLVSGLHVVRSGSKAPCASSERNGEKAMNKTVGVRYPGVMHNVDSDQNVSSEKGKESVKLLEGGSSNIAFAGIEVGKRVMGEAVPLDICKENCNFVSDSKNTHRQASGNAAVLENMKERDFVEVDSNFLGEVSSNTDDTLAKPKVGSLVLSRKECGSTVREPTVSETSIDEHSEDPHSKAEGTEKSLDGITVYENPGLQKSVAEKGLALVVNRYSSKLHEKLAFLEGKVQRIASDIKRTKEMLEQNNPDASKLILSDIQNKICGIEKAVSNVIGGTEVDLGSSNSVKDGNLHSKPTEKNFQEEVGGLKNLVKELNHEELEARFFPHHKLLRSRTSLTHSGEQDKSCKATLPEQNCGPVVERGSLSPIDENSIALEFLASLSADKPKVDIHNKCVLFDSAAIQQVESEKATSSGDHCVSRNLIGGAQDMAFMLTSDEKIEEFEDQESKPAMVLREGIEDSNMDQLLEIGHKSSTGGWFVSEGEAVLLAHSDGSCSYFDIANNEEKAEYSAPVGISNNLWGDCWLIRAPGVDGCSGRYVVAASAGNTLDSGFCSWDFYTKDVCAFRVEDGRSTSLSSASSLSRTVLGPLPNTALYRRSSLCTTPALRSQQWWYRPCGPLLVSTCSRQTVVNAYDIRDGELVMTWEVQNPVTAMEYSSPLQWRSRGKVVIAEPDGISLWDVNSVSPRPLTSVASGKTVTALHVNNTDAELGGGVRQRIGSSEIEGNDGVFCTQENINVIDLRLPSGVGLKVSKPGCNSHSVFSRGDSIYLGCTEAKLGAKGTPSPILQQFSLRKGRLAASYPLPDSHAHITHSSLNQVWGNYNLVMGICGMGLFVFDALRNDGMPSVTVDQGNTTDVREIIGPSDLYYPSFDYLGSRVLVISRDRPAMWRYML